MKGTYYRVYAGGYIVCEDDFEEHDNAQPYYDDYGTFFIPDELHNYISEGDMIVALKEQISSLKIQAAKLEDKYLAQKANCKHLILRGMSK